MATTTTADPRKIANATDAELVEWLANAKTTLQAERLAAELDRRDDIERRIAALVEQGWLYRDAYAEVHGLDPAELDRQERRALVRENRVKGETVEQTVDRMYGDMVDQAYVRAETECRGHLLNDNAPQGYNPRDLFWGPAARVRKYASEELRDWFAANGRMAWIEYMALMLGRPADVAAAAKVDKDLGETRAA